MSDTTLNQFLARGTSAQRVAFTPSPPTPAAGPSSGYSWFETDTGLLYAWNGSAWQKASTGGSVSSVVGMMLDGQDGDEGMMGPPGATGSGGGGGGAGALIFLHSASGTDTNAAATNVDTTAISGLTSLDTLYVRAVVGSTTQATLAPRIWHVTDGLSLGTPSTNISAGQVFHFTWTVGQRQTSNLKTSTVMLEAGVTTFPQTLVTAWTAPWTLALRHNGVTAGGTFDYAWSVYKLVGQ